MHDLNRIHTYQCHSLARHWGRRFVNGLRGECCVSVRVWYSLTWQTLPDEGKNSFVAYYNHPSSPSARYLLLILVYTINTLTSNVLTSQPALIPNLVLANLNLLTHTKLDITITNISIAFSNIHFYPTNPYVTLIHLYLPLTNHYIIPTNRENTITNLGPTLTDAHLTFTNLALIPFPPWV